MFGSVRAGGPTWGSQKGSLEEAAGRTCPHRSSPFQQQLEAVQLAVESSQVQRGVSIGGLGIQVATARRGLREVQGRKRAGKGVKIPGEREGPGGRGGTGRLLMADRLSPILDEEVH